MNGVDVLRFAPGIRPEQLQLQRRTITGLSGTDTLEITFRDSNDSLTLRDYFISSHAIEQIAFADGTLWLPEDVLNYIEHNIPLPVMDTAESTADIALLKQEICQFLASGDVDDADDAGVAIPLATAQTTAENWRTAIGY
jgi:hypothetical protein